MSYLRSRYARRSTRTCCIVLSLLFVSALSFSLIAAQAQPSDTWSTSEPLPTATPGEEGGTSAVETTETTESSAVVAAGGIWAPDLPRWLEGT